MGALISKCINRKKRSIVMIGPANCGKRELVLGMKGSKEEMDNSSDLYESLKIYKKGYAMEVFNLSEKQDLSQFWRFYADNCDLVVYVVDISTTEAITHSKAVFSAFYTSYGMHKDNLIFILNKGSGLSEGVFSETLFFFQEQFGSLPGIDKKSLPSKTMGIASQLDQKKMLSFICKHLK
ncbi:hypothetical protein NEOKW01_0486 [Nematocida sp. AWRm80]|nr:hypothetical protein NEOKW01_0486 [Nematocida sp. AWRm80]